MQHFKQKRAFQACFRTRLGKRRAIVNFRKSRARFSGPRLDYRESFVILACLLHGGDLRTPTRSTEEVSMKKVLAIGMLAVGLIALSQEQASAWSNHRFSMGLSWSRQSGGNNFAWGLWRNGQPPGPESFGQHSYMVPSYSGEGAPSHHHHHGSHSQEAPSTVYPSPYQFATYPRQQQEYYYYPMPYYYYYVR
jgi:hypothetical protein